MNKIKYSLITIITLLLTTSLYSMESNMLPDSLYPANAINKNTGYIEKTSNMQFNFNKNRFPYLIEFLLIDKKEEEEYICQQYIQFLKKNPEFKDSKIYWCIKKFFEVTHLLTPEKRNYEIVLCTKNERTNYKFRIKTPDNKSFFYIESFDDYCNEYIFFDENNNAYLKINGNDLQINSNSCININDNFFKIENNFTIYNIEQCFQKNFRDIFNRVLEEHTELLLSNEKFVLINKLYEKIVTLVNKFSIQILDQEIQEDNNKYYFDIVLPIKKTNKKNYSIKYKKTRICFSDMFRDLGLKLENDLYIFTINKEIYKIPSPLTLNKMMERFLQYAKDTQEKKNINLSEVKVLPDVANKKVFLVH